MYKPTAEEIENLYQRLKKETESAGYYLNPDVAFTKDLIEGILVNQKRYGYWNCPCRLATGIKEKDLDIICPCDYRDPDLNEYGCCYCSLYVSKKVLNGEIKSKAIPERRMPEDKRMEESKKNEIIKENQNLSSLSQPVWRCKVCGYLCARPEAPDTCPICKVPKERFERFI